MANTDEQKGKQLQIELDEETGKGTYANLAIVTHSPAEFVMDFTQLMPGLPKAKVRSRVVMAPLHAKAFALALQDNIKKYEANFGEINVRPDQWPSEIGFRLPEDKLKN